jgi:hypothetical protein
MFRERPHQIFRRFICVRLCSGAAIASNVLEFPGPSKFAAQRAYFLLTCRTRFGPPLVTRSFVSLLRRLRLANNRRIQRLQPLQGSQNRCTGVTPFFPSCSLNHFRKGFVPVLARVNQPSVGFKIDRNRLRRHGCTYACTHRPCLLIKYYPISLIWSPLPPCRGFFLRSLPSFAAILP